MQGLQKFLTLDTDSLLQDPQWKRVEEEECVFHSISVLRRTTISTVPQDGLTNVPTPQAPSATITKLGSSLMSGMTYITGKVCRISCLLCAALKRSTATDTIANKGCIAMEYHINNYLGCTHMPAENFSTHGLEPLVSDSHLPGREIASRCVFYSCSGSLLTLHTQWQAMPCVRWCGWQSTLQPTQLLAPPP